MTPAFDYAARMRRARGEMTAAGIDVLLLSVGRDLTYLTGYDAPLLERLTMAVIPADAEATLVVPLLEAPKVAPQPEAFSIRPWGETEDPIAIVADLAGSPGTAAVGDQTWAVFVLALQDRMAGTRFAAAAPLSAALRIVKSQEEIALLRAAGASADRVAGRLASTTFSDHTEAELSRAVASMLVEEGHDMAGMAIVGAGSNGASPHHHASDRRISAGDVVVVDFGGTLGGYHSDTTRTFYVGGDPAGEEAEVHEIVRSAQEAGYRAAAVGAAAQDVDRAARAVIDDAGYGAFFVHRTGHGIGLDVHEEPYIVEGNTTTLSPGMAFSIEPGIYLPGRFGVRIEDIVVMGPDGPERLNRSPRRPLIVG